MRLQKIGSSPRRISILIFSIFAIFLVIRSIWKGNRDEVTSKSSGLKWLTANTEDVSERFGRVPLPGFSIKRQSILKSKLVRQNKAMWKRLQRVLQEARPSIDKIKIVKTDQMEEDYQQSKKEGRTYFPDMIVMTDTEVTTMKQAHDNFVSKIRSMKLVYQRQSRGIVTTARSQSLGSVVMTLTMLRRTGCSLPAEIFVPVEEDASSKICTEILADLGASCIVISSIIGPLEENPELAGNRYLNKLFAMIFSSFDDMLFLDGDNLPVLDPNTYFDQEPYLSQGLVAWPDFWPSSISAINANVTSTTFPPIKGTVEAGQLLVSKRMHAGTLLLAFYYNFYGPDYYYTLQSQGFLGFGDKGNDFLSSQRSI